MKISAVITAAGLSSRMGDFKPMLELNGFPMAAMTAASLLDAGAHAPVAVVGWRGDEVAAVLEPLGACAVSNPDPGHSDMLDSIRRGLPALPECDAFFILPGDMPAISAKTMRAMVQALNQATDYILPAFREKSGHPPLIRTRCVQAIFNFRGEGGLRGALSGLSGKILAVDDPGVCMDADTQMDFARLTDYVKKIRGISPEMCETVYAQLYVPEPIRAHCRAVGARCRDMTARLNAHGCGLDSALCVSAGLLHDIFKAQGAHADRVRAYLRGCGYLALAELTGSHKRFSKNADLCDEATIVTLADRTLSGTETVPPDTRYAPALNRFPAGKAPGDAIRRDLAKCIALYSAYETIEITR